MCDARLVQPIVLQGAHVRLEPLSATHLDGLVAAAAHDQSTYAFTLVPADRAAMQQYVEAALANQAHRVALPFATVDASSGRVLGSTRFGNLEYWKWPAGHAAQRGPRQPDAAEIGWTWLTAAAQRTAVNTEAKLLMLTHAFETWQLHRVTLRTDARNLRSRRAIERLGAQLDGVLRAHLPAVDGGIRDSACYSLLAAEWPAVKAGLVARL